MGRQRASLQPGRNAPACLDRKDTVMNRTVPRALMAPAVATLLLWMIVPLAMTIYFSAVRYNLMQPGEHPDRKSVV